MSKENRWWHPLYRLIKRQDPPSRFKHYTLRRVVFKFFRKWICQVVAPNCVFNNIRILLYRMCGFKIGKHVFIGMKCYLDDMCFDLITIGNNVTISYGVYFACHGKHQNHYSINIEDGVYIGMRASIISKNSGSSSEEGITISKNAIIGACALVNRNIPEGVTAVGVPCRIIESS